MQTAGHESNETAVREAFARYDTDGNGSLSSAELTMVATDLGTDLHLIFHCIFPFLAFISEIVSFCLPGANFTKNELVAVFNLLDQDRSGDVSYEEFSRWWFGDKSVDYSII